MNNYFRVKINIIISILICLLLLCHLSNYNKKNYFEILNFNNNKPELFESTDSITYINPNYCLSKNCKAINNKKGVPCSVIRQCNLMNNSDNQNEKTNSENIDNSDLFKTDIKGDNLSNSDKLTEENKKIILQSIFIQAGEEALER